MKLNKNKSKLKKKIEIRILFEKQNNIYKVLSFLFLFFGVIMSYKTNKRCYQSIIPPNPKNIFLFNSNNNKHIHHDPSTINWIYLYLPI